MVPPLIPGTVPQPGPSVMSNFRGFTTKRPTGCCFAFGEFPHYRRDCPYTTAYSSSKIIPGNEAARKHDYLKDKYSYCDSDNLENFTTDYFEYEQGQKPIIVKDRLKPNVDFWKALGAGNLILDTILNGYQIHFFSTPQKLFRITICLQNNILILSIKPQTIY